MFSMTPKHDVNKIFGSFDLKFATKAPDNYNFSSD